MAYKNKYLIVCVLKIANISSSGKSDLTHPVH